MFKAFLKVEVPRRAVRVVDRNDECTRLGKARGQPAERADIAAEAMAREDHGKRPLRHPGTVENRGAEKDGVLAVGNRFAAVAGRIPERAGYLAPVMLCGDCHTLDPAGSAAAAAGPEAGRGCQQLFHRLSLGADRMETDCGGRNGRARPRSGSGRPSDYLISLVGPAGLEPATNGL